MWRRAVWAGLVAVLGLLGGCQDGGLLPTAAQADQVAPSVDVRVSSSKMVPVGAWPAQLSRVQRPEAP